MKSLLTGVLLSAFVSGAFAAESVPTMTAKAIAAATEEFEKNDAASLLSYTGVKGWPNGNSYAVKVYLDKNNSVNYSCAMMTMNGHEHMMCDKQ